MNRNTLRYVLALICLVASGATFAQAVTGSLVDVSNAGGYNALERAAARANQASYNRLLPACGGGVGAQCSAGDFVVFQNTRELVETANELTGNGPTQFSLGLDSQGLGFALRWTAAEELAGQGASTTKFAASQLSALATRLSVLRWGVSGLRRAFNDADDDNDDVLLADNGGHRSIGGASGDDLAASYKWGSFIDGSFGYGTKDPTDLEDAFDFDGQEVTIGVDYRFNPAFVAGVIAGYSDKEIDFDSRLSIVDGGIKSNGYSLIAFGMLESERAYATASLGLQRLDHDTTRRITYPSLNPSVASVDSTARSSASSTAVLATATGGYTFRMSAFTIEPTLEVSYSDTTVDAFTERSVDNRPGGAANDPFDLRIGKQSIESLDVAPALKFQYVFTPRFGALIPYLVGRYHFQLSDDARAISARYADALGSLVGAPGTDFAVSTDVPDEEYYTVSGGFTVVFGNGFNGYVQYLKVLDLDSYTDAVITGGFRYEF
jgi:uncharacterized protein with beta-barrel porin domain